MHAVTYQIAIGQEEVSLRAYLECRLCFCMENVKVTTTNSIHTLLAIGNDHYTTPQLFFFIWATFWRQTQFMLHCISHL